MMGRPLAALTACAILGGCILLVTAQSSFYVDNQTAYDLTLKLYYSDTTDETKAIGHDTRARIKTLELGEANVVYPSYAFLKLELLRMIEAQNVVVYSQDPIDNSKWLRRDGSGSDDDEFELVITATEVP